MIYLDDDLKKQEIVNNSDDMLSKNPSVPLSNKEGFIELGRTSSFRKTQQYDPTISFKKKDRGSLSLEGNGIFYFYFSNKIIICFRLSNY